MSARAVAAITLGVLAAVALAGCGGGQRAPAPAPEPVAPPASPVSVPVIGVLTHFPVSVCLVRDGRIETVVADYNPATGDSTVGGRPVREAYPVTDQFAAARPWFVNDEPIVYAGWRYVKYGLPRSMVPGDLVAVGTAGGVTVFAEPGASRSPLEVMYLPVSPYCEFQPYTGPETAHAVRG